MVFTVVIASIAIMNYIVIPEKKYQQAEELLSNKDYDGAIQMFEELGDYKDAEERSFALLGKIFKRKTISANGVQSVGVKIEGSVAAAGNNEYGQCDVDSWRDIKLPE